jgi:hypothetical protein
VHLGAAGGTTPHLEASTGDVGAVVHARDPEVPGLLDEVLGLDADAVVAHQHRDAVVAARQLHVDAGGAGVLPGVGQGFLDDAVRRDALGLREVGVQVSGDSPPDPGLGEDERGGLVEGLGEVVAARGGLEVEQQVTQALVASVTVSWSARRLSASSGDRSMIRGTSIASRRSTAASACTESSWTSAAIRERSSSWACTRRCSSTARCSARSRRSCSVASRSRMSRWIVATANGRPVRVSWTTNVEVVTGMSGLPSSGCTADWPCHEPCSSSSGQRRSKAVSSPSGTICATVSAVTSSSGPTPIMRRPCGLR